jgi:Uma2 family endonuclease
MPADTTTQAMRAQTTKHHHRQPTSTSALHRNGPQSARQLAVPLLLNADHLSVPEFERRYEAMQDDRKVELIEGIAITSPPISGDHGKANSLLNRLLGHYAAATPDLAVYVNTSVRLDGSNEYQPDVILRIESGKLAGAKSGASGIFEGRPEMVVEIALSSASYDLHEKKTVYQRNQIPEYLVWEVMDARIHWFGLEAGGYVLLPARPDGSTPSRVFPGLWLDLPALLRGDEKRVFRVVERGLKSAEHKAFIKKLAKS